MTNRIASILAAAALAVFDLPGQSPGPRPQFEVASIRPSLSELNFGPHCAGDGPSPGRLRLRCNTVQELIQFAYGFYANGVTLNANTLHISGGPGWTDSARFDIRSE